MFGNEGLSEVQRKPIIQVLKFLLPEGTKVKVVGGKRENVGMTGKVEGFYVWRDGDITVNIENNGFECRAMLEDLEVMK